MTTRPEALRLAQELDAYHTRSCHKEAAAELRRQHGEIKSMRAERLRSERRLLYVKAQRDALLEALKYHQEQTRPIQGTLDVIKAVEEGK